MNVGYITELKNVRKHPNADRLLLGDCFGNTVCVRTDCKEGQLGIYFQSGLQLSEEFCNVNDLVRRKDENGNDVGGYLDPIKRNIKAISLRGEKSDGLFLPIEALDYCFEDDKAINHFSKGDTIDTVNGKEICCKYIPKNSSSSGKYKNKNKNNSKSKRKINIAPTFFEHVDTDQLAYNLNAFKPGDLVEITLKMHGTSQRTGYLKVFKGYKCKNKLEQFCLNLLDKEDHLTKFKQKIYDNIIKQATPIYDWDYISGTRRTIMSKDKPEFYGTDEFRRIHERALIGKLHKGETIYYEVVGYTDNKTPIMGSCSNDKLGKDFVKKYGRVTTFDYGCDPNGLQDHNTLISVTVSENEDKILEFNSKRQSDFYAYRMTMTNEDGEVVEYSYDYMKYRCEQMGVKVVPLFAKVILPSEEYFDEEHSVGNYVKEMAEQYYDGPDPIGKTHVREGVVVRIVNRPTFKAYKHKNHEFKMLSGIITEQIADSETADDMEADILTEL